MGTTILLLTRRTLRRVSTGNIRICPCYMEATLSQPLSRAKVPLTSANKVGRTCRCQVLDFLQFRFLAKVGRARRFVRRLLRPTEQSRSGPPIGGLRPFADRRYQRYRRGTGARALFTKPASTSLRSEGLSISAMASNFNRAASACLLTPIFIFSCS